MIHHIIVYSGQSDDQLAIETILKYWQIICQSAIATQSTSIPSLFMKIVRKIKVTVRSSSVKHSAHFLT